TYLSQAIRIKGRDLAQALRKQPDFQDLPWPKPIPASEDSAETNRVPPENLVDEHPLPPSVPLDIPGGDFRQAL
ncbi:MAG: hypothetical protein OSB09_10585, partial [Planctomycetota bacterium]|nr:hypothetical protein [Planctomycetota bacterium]